MNANCIAVVVTYNRLDVLKQCLTCLETQTVSCDVVVIDNASTDGTQSYLQEYVLSHSNVFYQNTGANLGGAGGFNYGVRWAVEAGYAYLWLMDDDCLPNSDALEKLTDAAALLQDRFGWLSGVALWTDGTECRMNRQKIKKHFYAYAPFLKYGIVQAEQATFISLFLKSSTVVRVGLPLAEYWIWGDDIEYTRRIAIREKIDSFIVKQCQVVHAMKDNIGSSIDMDSLERLGRYRFAYRNEMHLSRQEGIRGIARYIAKCGYNILKVVKNAPDRKLLRCSIILSSMVKGIFFSPKTEMVEAPCENRQARVQR